MTSLIGSRISHPPALPESQSFLGFVFALVLVSLTTWILRLIDRVVEAGASHSIRPYGIGFMIPITAATVFAGRASGYFAVILSSLAMSIYLTPGHFLSAPSAPDSIELAFLLLAGCAMVLGMGSLRRLKPLLDESREAATRLRAVMDSAPVGVLLSTIEGTVRYANVEAERILGRHVEGIRLDACEYGGDGAPDRPRGRPSESILTPCLAGREVEMREWSLQRPDGADIVVEARATLVRNADGKPINGLVTLADITNRKRAEQIALTRANREALINRIGEASRASLDPDEIQHIAVAALGDALKVDRAYFITYELSAGHAWIGQDFYREGLSSLSGHYRIVDMRIRPEQLYRRGRTLVLDDVRAAGVPAALATDFDRLKMRSMIGAPLYAENQIVASLVVAMADEPRRWSAEEVVLVEAVAAQTRSGVETARLIIQEQNRRRHEEVASRIAQTLRYATEPDIILARVLQIIGSAVEADRCCYFHVEPTDGSIWIADDYHRDELSDLRAEDRRQLLNAAVGELVSAGTTLVVDDVTLGPWSNETIQAWSKLGIKSLVSTPIFEQDSLNGLLVVAMAAVERAWKADDVRLIEAATSQTRLTLEAARARARDHAVAEALQQALQPKPRANRNQIDVDYYYQPALDEASVGGDFYDVYELDETRHALVIGDVSGKGIAAAAQIASVRNMLRYVLAHERNLAVGITRLNDTLARSNELVGFATLFVGIYDRRQGALLYCSCGHEPAIIRRSDDTVALLGATGPPVGAIDDADYEMGSAVLNPGDTLLLYTDGISEAGPNRRSLLGVEGIVEIVRRVSPAASPSELINRLIADVKEYSRGILRDDVCVVAIAVEPVVQQPLQLVARESFK